MNHGQIVSFIWGVADLIRDTFKRGKYRDVILPLTVLRRLDCVLAPTLQERGPAPGSSAQPDDQEFAKFFLDWLFERFRLKVIES